MLKDPLSFSLFAKALVALWSKRHRDYWGLLGVQLRKPLSHFILSYGLTLFFDSQEVVFLRLTMETAHRICAGLRKVRDQSPQDL